MYTNSKMYSQYSSYQPRFSLFLRFLLGLTALTYSLLVLCQENGHVKQREIAELRQLLFSGWRSK
jgi:hypothetical protein